MNVGDRIIMRYKYLDSNNSIREDSDDGFVNVVYKNREFVLSDRQDGVQNPRRYHPLAIVSMAVYPVGN